MSSNSIRICDIYPGKPDAKDEVTYNGDQLIDSFILPPQFDPASILSRNQYYIVGDKGSGKTALLWYLEHYFRTQDPSTCTSFLLFKSDYNESDRTKIAVTGQRIINALVTDNSNIPNKNCELLARANDFTGLWLWHLFRRIIDDNEKCDCTLFVNDKNWRNFKSVISSVLKEERKPSIFSGFTLSLDTSPMFPTLPAVPSITLNLNDGSGKQRYEYMAFPDYIDLACQCFAKTTRTDIPYYIFVDELEAYFGEKSIFVRDLELIRDLLFSAKKVNDLLVGMRTSSRIFCSVRQEILNSIFNNDSILPRELNRIISGFSYRLQWHAKVSEGFDHPILQILLRRIEMTEEKAGIKRESRQELIDHWFPDPEKDSACRYILNHSWHKPRDIVRLLTALKNCTDTHFSENNLQASLGEYSRDSLDELQEELRAVYDTSQVESVLRVLRGGPDQFTAEELQDRARSCAPGSPLGVNVHEALSVLYRQGFVGNITFNPTRYRLQCRGANDPVFSSDWLFYIHVGLQKTLSTIPASRKWEDLPSAFPDVDDDSDNENPALWALGREGVLFGLERSTTGIRGTIELDGQVLVGTLSNKYLNDLGLSNISVHRLEYLSPRVAIFALNPIDPKSPNSPASYRVSLVEPNTIKEAVEQLSAPPERGEVYTLKHLSFTKSGQVKGLFRGDYKGILSAKELNSYKISPQQLVNSGQEVSACLKDSETFSNGSVVYYMTLTEPQAVQKMLSETPSTPGPTT